jgi:hypothetical protein
MRLTTFKGETRTTAQWAARIGITPESMHLRLNRVDAGTLDLERALTRSHLATGGDRKSASKGYINEHMVTHDGRTQSVKAWAAEVGRSPQVMATRIKRWEDGVYTEDQTFGKAALPCGGDYRKRAERRKPVNAEMAAMIDVPYADDPYAQKVVNANLGEGLSLDEIGQLYGMSRERVRQIENGAMRKIARRMRGDEAAKIVSMLRAIEADRPVNTNSFELVETLEYGGLEMRKTNRKKAKAATP